MEEQETELQLLKERADLMGISYHKNIGIDSLKRKLENADKKEEEAITAGSSDKIKNLVKVHSKLVRFTLSCNDPQFSNRGGIMMNVSNSHMQFAKFIPFDVEYHAPKIIVDELRNRTYIKSSIVKDKVTGRKVVKRTVAKAFVVDELKPLTKQELEELAQSQKRSGAVD